MHCSPHFSQVRLFKFADYMSAHAYIATFFATVYNVYMQHSLGSSLACKHSLLDKEDIPIARVHNSHEAMKVMLKAAVLE